MKANSTKQPKNGKKKPLSPKMAILLAVLSVIVIAAVITVLAVMGGKSSEKKPIKTEPVETVATDRPNETNMTIQNDAPKGPFNLLTGEPCTEEVAKERPVAIMINNIHAAWPQYNTSMADIMYECEVEGGSTRMMAVYSHVAEVEDSIGSIRSSREYYIDFAANHDAIYVHAGGSDSAYNQLQSRGTDHLDGVNGGAETRYYVRDPRRAGMKYEHQLCISGTDLVQAIAARGFRTTISDTFKNSMQFNEYGKSAAPAGSDATYVTTPFAAATANFEFNADTQKYDRYEYGVPQTDALHNDVQLSFDNVIVVFCPYSNTGDAKGHINVDTVGSGDGYYISRGKYVPIKWTKSGMDTPIVYQNTDGSALTVNTGKTFISIVSTDRKDQVTFTK